MAYFSKKTKQKIIDDYLNVTGANMFVPSEFIDWLAGQPNHEAYEAFYGMDDHEAARQYRIEMARRLASGLRIVAKSEVVESDVTAITVKEYPAYISPVSSRKDGGGYERFNPDDEASQYELRRQAGVALAAWINRYRGCVEHVGLDLSALEEMVHVLRDDKEESDVRSA